MHAALLRRLLRVVFMPLTHQCFQSFTCGTSSVTAWTLSAPFLEQRKIVHLADSQ